jgi:D-arabinose 1-dehydrogenase-like Zn-dependent alcohol dehydrogenase
MRAVTVRPGIANSVALATVMDPSPAEGAVLVRALALGICGSDREIIAGEYGWAPPGADHLILGHESLGRIIEGPARSGFTSGDLVAGIVRRPDPVPCSACAQGAWDMCRNGQYTERGIKEWHGYGSELFRVEPEFLIKIDPQLGLLGVLLEPTSVVAKAWEHVQRIGSREKGWQARCALITGAGPIGLPAAMMGAQQGVEIHVLDRNAEGLKPELVRALGGTYHTKLADDASGHPHRMHRRVARRARRARPRRARRRGVSRRRILGRPSVAARCRRVEPQYGFAKSCDLRFGERQPPALRGGRRSTREGRREVARAPDHAPRAACTVAGRLPAPAGRHQGPARIQRVRLYAH